MPDIATPQTPSAAESVPVSIPAPEAPNLADVLAAVGVDNSLLGGLGSTLYTPPANSPAPVQPAPTPVQSETPTPPPAEPAAAVQPSGDTPAVDPEAVAEPDPGTEEAPAELADPVTGKAILPRTIPTKHFEDIDKEAIALQHELRGRGVNIDLGEASARVKAKYQPTEAAGKESSPAAEAAPAAQPSARRAALEAEVAGLRGQLKEAAEGHALLTPELLEVQTQFAEKVGELAAIKAGEEQTQSRAQESSQAALIAARRANVLEVAKHFPTANQPASPLGTMVTALVAEIRADPQHPHQELLAGEDAPSKIATLAASRLRTSLQAANVPETTINVLIHGTPTPGTAAAPRAAAPAAGPKPVPRTAIVSSPGSGATPAAAPSITANDLLQGVLEGRVDPGKALAAAGGNSGTLSFGNWQ